MKVFQKAFLAVLLLLLVAALAAIFFTRQWANSPAQLNVSRAHQNYSSEPVDTRALQTARQLAPLAVTPEEHEYALEALRLADKSVDYAFDAALRDAEENPPEPTPETRELSVRLKQAQADVAADEDRVASLTQKLAAARPSAKEDLQQQLDLAQEQLSLDKDEAEDAHQDLIRAGGDTRATIQQRCGRLPRLAFAAHKRKSPPPGSAKCAGARRNALRNSRGARKAG